MEQIVVVLLECPLVEGILLVVETRREVRLAYQVLQERLLVVVKEGEKACHDLLGLLAWEEKEDEVASCLVDLISVSRCMMRNGEK